MQKTLKIDWAFKNNEIYEETVHDFSKNKKFK